MNRVFRIVSPKKGPWRSRFSTFQKVDYRDIAASVNEEVNTIGSLWGMRNIKIKGSQYFKDDLILKLAAKHLGHSEVDKLVSLSPEISQGNIFNTLPPTRIIYEENIGKDIDLTDNDIWLGYSKYMTFLNLSLKYSSKNAKYFMKDLENADFLRESRSNGRKRSTVGVTQRDFEEFKAEVDKSENFENYTIFVFPYMRKTSKPIVEVLDTKRSLLSRSDFRSLIYTCGSTGSSRLLRFLGRIVNENFSHAGSNSSIHKVESHAWPWMCKNDEEGKDIDYNLPVLLDALASCCIIRYSIDDEANIYDYVISSLKGLDDKIQQLTEKSQLAQSEEAEGEGKGEGRELQESTNNNNNYYYYYDNDHNHYQQNLDEELHRLTEYDNVVLEKVLSILLIKRNLDKLGSNQIRAFSDFVCDRLHRIKPKILANIAFSLGHSKNLDEFWMFMLSKQIQSIFTANMAGSENRDKERPHQSEEEFGQESTQESLGKLEGGNLDRFDMDDVTAILDSYSTSGLEDYNFYSLICKGIEEDFPKYSLHHKSVIIRSLARVRHRDQKMLDEFMESLKVYVRKLEEQSREKELVVKDEHQRKKLETLRSHLIKPVDCYIVANAIVSACDLDFRSDEIDCLWRVMTLKIRDSSFDICAISWLPIATITFPSEVSLREFLPVWMRHVNYTIPKLKSRTYMMTIQRRLMLMRHAFNLGILPTTYLSAKSKRILEELCDRNYITCKNDYTPESSTFHLEVCASLRALGVTHQREINILPFVMDIVISPEKVVEIKSFFTSEEERASDLARCGNISSEGDLESFPLKYSRNSPNHRKHKQEIYTFVPKL